MDFNGCEVRLKINDMNTKLKLIIGGVGAALVGFAVWRVVRGAKEDKAKDEQNEILNNTLKELDPEAATLTAAQATETANLLWQAMKDAGTDSDLIESLILSRNLTSSDMKMVVTAFGTKPYSYFGEPEFSWLPSENLNLIEWLRRECESDLFDKIAIKLKQAGFMVNGI